MDQEAILSAATWVFAGATTILALYGTLPHLLPALGLDFFRTGIEGGPSDLDPEGKGETYADLYRQLIELGFEPLGKSWERVILGRKIVSFVFQHRKEGCRASIWPLLGGDYRMYFLTMFADAGALLTANYPRVTVAAEDYLAQGAPTAILAYAFARHRQFAKIFIERGLRVWPPETLEDIPRMKQTYHHFPAVLGTFRQNKWSIFWNRGLLVALLPATAGALTFLTGYSSFLACLIALLTCIFFSVKLKESLGKALKDVEVQQQDADRARQQDRG